MVFHVKHSDRSEREAAIAAAGVSRETAARLDIFVDELERWSGTLNLVSRSDLPHLWSRHVGDSLQLLSLLPPGCPRMIDLGSGGGFPGLVLAIASGVPVDLVEADQRKAAFLREAARRSAAPATVHTGRAEHVRIEPAPVITARALASLPALLEMAAPLLAPGGRCLFLKGAQADAELTLAAAEWHMHVDRIPSRTGVGGVILQFSEIRRVSHQP